MWEIKDKNGNVRAIPSTKPEYTDTWMGECYVTVTVESPTPIDFQIGDYIEYRDERFEINYDPGKIKSAPREVTGDAFKYEDIKFNSLADELTRCEFLDVVLADNNIHYTALPKVSFYAPTVQELADRIKANLDRLYPGMWTIEVHPEFANKTDVNISVDNIKVWDALALATNEFEAYFTIKGRHITIGTAGLPASHLFKYGKGNGLYQLEQQAESDQAIVTRLRAYGSTRNLPYRYYHNLPVIDRAEVPIHSIISQEYINNGKIACLLKFRLSGQYVNLSKCYVESGRYWFVASINDINYVAYWDAGEQCYVVGGNPPARFPDGGNSILRAADMELIKAGTIFAFENYIENAPGIVKGQHVPNNMAITNLMLPGFPTLTLDPYIDSGNIEALGVREDSIFFDGSGDLDEIYPSIEDMTAEQLHAAGVSCNAEGALDEILSVVNVTDDGVGEIKGDQSELSESDAYFTVRVKDLGFDINETIIAGNGNTPTINFKSGKLGGRDFEISQCTKITNSAGAVESYELKLKRVFDDGIKLWFPYSDYNAAPGDKFVLLYIDMPDIYVKAAAQRLYEAAVEWLAKNDYSRSIYTPSVDEIFMARQHDAAMASGGKIQSLHDTLKAGMLLLFEDEDLNINASVFIDKLVIKEEGTIPTYEITLKEEKTVGTLDKIQNQIDSLSSGKGQGNGGYNAAQIRAMIETYGNANFLSKLKNDRTPYTLSVGELETNDFISGYSGAKIDARGNAEVESLTSRSYLKVFELIYNRLNALEGEYAFCDSAAIESVATLADGSVELKFRDRWEGDFNAFQPYDIIYGFVNSLDASGTYAKAWGNIVEVDRAANTARVVMYSNAGVPGGYNADFTPNMLVARHGNSLEPNASSANAYPAFIKLSSAVSGKYVNQRQSSFFISAPDGCIKYLHGVDSPITRPDNIGMALGRMPNGLFPSDTALGKIAADGDPRVYAKGIVTQELIRTDYRGLTIRTQNYRGEWSATPEVPYANNEELYDVVTLDGIMFMCATDGTTSRPDPNNPACGWIPLTDHRDLNIWSIEANVDVLHRINNGTAVVPDFDAFEPYVKIHSASGVEEIHDNETLISAYGRQLVWINVGDDALRDTNNSVITDTNGDRILASECSLPTSVFVEFSELQENVGVALVNLTTGEIELSRIFPIVADGEPGKDGEDGNNGPMAYPAGVYNSETEYDSRGGASPIVYFEGQYFLLKEGNQWRGDMEQYDPATDSTLPDARWILVDKFNAIFTDVLLADFAKLSAAVCYSNYLFSQYGKDLKGNESTDYQNFDKFWPGGQRVFTPNLLIDLLRGEIHCSTVTAGNTTFSEQTITSIAKEFGSATMTGDIIGDGEAKLVKKGAEATTVTLDKDIYELTVNGTASVRFKGEATIETTSVRTTNSAISVVGEMTVSIVRSDGGSEKVIASGSTVGGTFTTQTVELNFPTVTLSTGTYKIRVVGSLKFSNAGSPNLAEGSGSLVCKIIPEQTVLEGFYRSQYFSNGFLIGNASTNYIAGYLDSEKGFLFAAENKNGHGIRVTESGIQIKHGIGFQPLDDYIANLVAQRFGITQQS